MKNNLTTTSPLKAIILFTLPIIFGNLFQILYGMTDAAIVGRTLGPDALAAIGATGSPQWLVLSFSIGICEGLCLVVSQKRLTFALANKEQRLHARQSLGEHIDWAMV